MGQKPKFDLSTLKEEAAQVKRRILERVRKGELEPRALTKTDCLSLFLTRPKLGLKSTRPLYDKDKMDLEQPGPRQLYLDKWFEGVLADAQLESDKVASAAKPASHEAAAADAQGYASVLKEVYQLREKVKVQVRTIQEYRRALDALRVENQYLRVQLEDKLKSRGELRTYNPPKVR